MTTKKKKKAKKKIKKTSDQELSSSSRPKKNSVSVGVVDCLCQQRTCFFSSFFSLF